MITKAILRFYKRNQYVSLKQEKNLKPLFVEKEFAKFINFHKNGILTIRPHETILN